MSGVTPIYLYRRKGHQTWATCDADRYADLRKMVIFATRIAYSAEDYDRLELERAEQWTLHRDAQADRDTANAVVAELRAQVEVMRALMEEAVPALQHISDTAQDLESFTLAERFRLVLQANHDRSHLFPGLLAQNSAKAGREVGDLYR